MSVSSLTQPEEVVALFLTDLQNNTAAAAAIREYVKEPADCGFEDGYAAALLDPTVVAAFEALRSGLPASTYIARQWQRYHVNDDTQALGTSSLAFAAQDANLDNNISKGANLIWRSFADASGPSALPSTLDPVSGDITITQQGHYRITTSFCLAFYPSNSLLTDYSDRVINYTSSNTALSVPVKIYVKVLTGGTGTPRAILRMVNAKMTQPDMANSRRRIFGGSIDLALQAGDVLRTRFERGGQLGSYLQAAGGTGGTSAEVLGCSKLPSNDPNNNPLRDTQNYIHVARLS